MLRVIVVRSVDWLAYLSLAFIAAAALITGLDVVLRQTIGSPIRGLVDLTQLAVMYAVFLSIAYGFAHRSHVAVTVLTEFMSDRSNQVLAMLWWGVATGVMCILSYASFSQAQLIFSYGDMSQNIRIPMILYWLPVAVGLGLSALGSLWAVAQTLDEIRNPGANT